MDRLGEAQRVFQDQYQTAVQLGSLPEMCRAVGNLGMVTYQLSCVEGNHKLLDSAIQYLEERVQRAREIKACAGVALPDLQEHNWVQKANSWESIGLSRLSLCYGAAGNPLKAIDVARAGLDLVGSSPDTTVVGISRLFYGRALLQAGKREEALEQFNLPWSMVGCTPAVAFSKEPSKEHRGYLRELIEAGARFDQNDEQGYKALEYAVFNGDAHSEDLVMKGLRRQYERDLEEKLRQERNEAVVRKGYREQFQEKLRPELRHKRGNRIRDIRKAYAQALEEDQLKAERFDKLKFVWYSDFLDSGRLPRHFEGAVHPFISTSGKDEESQMPLFLIFFSYRWVYKDAVTGRTAPDDSANTQYRRMLGALTRFLEQHPSVEPEKLGVWVDSSCVNRENPLPGVNALPMIIARCDAVISIADDIYWSRAWCAVEALMVQTLKRSYNHHLWYEYAAPQPDGEQSSGNGRGRNCWELREASLDLTISLSEKRMTYEEDRHKVMFLERQVKLMGRED